MKGVVVKNKNDGHINMMTTSCISDDKFYLKFLFDIIPHFTATGHLSAKVSPQHSLKILRSSGIAASV